MATLKMTEEIFNNDEALSAVISLFDEKCEVISCINGIVTLDVCNEDTRGETGQVSAYIYKFAGVNAIALIN